MRVLLIMFMCDTKTKHKHKDIKWMTKNSSDTLTKFHSTYQENKYKMTSRWFKNTAQCLSTNWSTLGTRRQWQSINKIHLVLTIGLKSFNVHQYMLLYTHRLPWRKTGLEALKTLFDITIHWTLNRRKHWHAVITCYYINIFLHDQSWRNYIFCHCWSVFGKPPKVCAVRLSADTMPKAARNVIGLPLTGTTTPFTDNIIRSSKNGLNTK